MTYHRFLLDIDGFIFGTICKTDRCNRLHFISFVRNFSRDISASVVFDASDVIVRTIPPRNMNNPQSCQMKFRGGYREGYDFASASAQGRAIYSLDKNEIKLITEF